MDLVWNPSSDYSQLADGKQQLQRNLSIYIFGYAKDLIKHTPIKSKPRSQINVLEIHSENKRIIIFYRSRQKLSISRN